MIGKVIGALVGAELERSRGGRGVAGAALGLVATAAMRRLGPLGLLAGGAFVAKRAYDRHRSAGVGRVPTDRDVPGSAG